ncbi:putative Tat-translocated enzyme [Neisseria gonorrhoeae]|uniref:Putative Tat-translocated enzyme n=1 Tax=Neisseria gonorrhoeae TaxID=485 RepID=A0A378W0Z2_NEIGO|nr:putative Tat-translocated enzyme [Neisseria gonorrhoeae]
MCAFDVTAQSAKQLENLFRTLTARIEFLTQGGEYQDGDDKLVSRQRHFGQAFNPDGLTVTVGWAAACLTAGSDSKTKNGSFAGNARLPQR